MCQGKTAYGKMSGKSQGILKKGTCQSWKPFTESLIFTNKCCGCLFIPVHNKFNPFIPLNNANKTSISYSEVILGCT